MRETSDVVGAARRMIKAVGIRVGQEDPADLIRLQALHAEVDRSMAAAVEGLRQGGHTDKAIGEALMMTRQAVQKRWPRTERVVGAGARYRSV